MLFQDFDWDLTHQVLFLYIYFAQPSYELERPALENAHTLVQRIGIFSCKFSTKVSLMLENPFLVPSRSKLNHTSLGFVRISTKYLQNCLFSSGKALFFWSHPQLGKSQHNIKISMKTALVFRLSVSYDYGLTCFNNFNKTDRKKINEEILTWQRRKILYWKYMSSISRFIYIIKFQINLMYRGSHRWCSLDLQLY